MKSHAPCRGSRRGRKSVQLELRPRSWGGARTGAGRPKAARSGVPHLARPELARPLPFHVTLRMATHVFNLRSRRSFRVIEKALGEGANRFGMRVVRFSVQGNHIHLLVEADDKGALLRGIKGLSVRLAKGMNHLMKTKGRVLGDRYHARPLRTPTEVQRAMDYIRDNARKHALEWGELLHRGWVDPYSSESPQLGIVLPTPETWLLRVGYKRARARPGPHPRE